tara:strand:- start:1333 stop:2019 length:687 start_codon:yes stop_codon:yes gene_type:complete
VPQTPTKTKVSKEITNFLKQGKAISTYRQKQSRLLFGIDATASRQPTWNAACRTQGELFTAAHQISNIAIQLCFYRGFSEFTVSNWLTSETDLKYQIAKVACQGGQTQILRLLKHAITEHNKLAVKALLFIGDACEEDLDQLSNLAGQCGLLQLPIFVFQEGTDKNATDSFRMLANLSGGVHTTFDASSASTLASLLGALSRYIVGGKNALEMSAQSGDKIFLEQLKN